MLPRLNISHSLQASRDEPSLNEIKRRKKNLELETQTLENRISQMQNEREKLLKKIEQADKLALDIYAQKVESIKKKEEKERLNKMKTSADGILYQKVVIERQQLRKFKEEVKQTKHYEAQMFKMSNMRELKMYKEQSLIQQELLKQKAIQLKQDEKLTATIIQDKLFEKKLKVKKDQLLEKQQVIEDNARYEQKLRDLEQEEIREIEKLQHTQQLEKEARDKYFNASKLKPEEFYTNYGNTSILTYNKSIISKQDPKEEEKKDNEEQEKEKEQEKEQEKEKEKEKEKEQEGQQGTQT